MKWAGHYGVRIMQPLNSATIDAGSGVPARAASTDERRASRRIAAAELPWIRSVKVANVGDVGLVNISTAGALLKCRTRLVPRQEVVLQFIGAGNRVRVKGQVVRCEVAAVRNGSSIDYEAAIAFEPDPCPLPVSSHLSVAWV